VTEEVVPLMREESPGTRSILGVVSANGVSGGRVPPDELWRLNLRVCPWRDNGGPLQATELRIAKTFSHDELRRIMDSVKAYDVLEILVEPIIDQSGAIPTAQMIRLAGVARDVDLERAAQELKKPVYYVDPQFGRLELDRGLNWLSCEPTWSDASVRLYASMDEAESEDAVLSTARTLWGNAVAWDARIRAFAADRLLELKNESWLEEGEVELTSAEFILRMAIESVTVYPEGQFEFTLDDGGLFWGHSINVTGNLQDGLTDAGISG
jgi:hypothetical protein